MRPIDIPPEEVAASRDADAPGTARPGCSPPRDLLAHLTGEPPETQERLGYRYTLEEICQQPATWRETGREMVGLADRLSAFLADAGIRRGCGALVLTGSGSSLFVGASVGPALQSALGIPVHVLAAGDLLTHPRQALPPLRPCVVVSFARSGDSPESTAVIDSLLAREPACRHLLVTCCRTGALATRYADDRRVCSVVLADRTCDRSLVMTSSFTNMLVAAGALSLLDDLPRYASIVESLSGAAESLLAADVSSLAAIGSVDYRTGLFLGAGCRHGGAREGSLKLTEMSDGRVLSFAETYLGLRHGPMSAVRKDALVVCFVSSDPLARAYEIDLVQEINRKDLGAHKVLVGEHVPSDLARAGDVIVDCATAQLGDDRLAALDVLVAQLLAFFHCLHLGLRPDAPSVAGVIRRVVDPFPIHGHG